MAKLYATRHQWIAKLAKYNFTIHYHSGKSNVNANTLSWIPWDQNIEKDTVETIFKAAVDSPKALMEVYACHGRAISSLILESPPTQMTATTGFRLKSPTWLSARITTCIESGKFSTTKVSEEMSPEIQQYLREKGQLCLDEGVLLWHRSQMQRDHNELQLVVPPYYRLEAMHWAHDDIGHVDLKHMLDILCDRFYWPTMEADATCHVHTCKWCLRFKSKPDKSDLCALLATHPLELVHMDFLTIEHPCTGANMNILIITDHFTWYAKVIVTSNQSTRVTVTAFWKEFIANYSFPERLLTDQEGNFESQLIKVLCKLAHICKVWTMPYHPKTNDQYERFNQMLINMINTLESTDEQYWKGYLPTLVHAYNLPRTMPWILAPTIWCMDANLGCPLISSVGLMSPNIGTYA